MADHSGLNSKLPLFRTHKKIILFSFISPAVERNNQTVMIGEIKIKWRTMEG